MQHTRQDVASCNSPFLLEFSLLNSSLSLPPSRLVDPRTLVAPLRSLCGPMHSSVHGPGAIALYVEEPADWIAEWYRGEL